MFRTPVDGFFPTFQGLKILVRVIEGGNHIENHLKGNENWFELEGVRVIVGFELPRVNCSECMTEIQGKSMLVRVSEGSNYREWSV